MKDNIQPVQAVYEMKTTIMNMPFEE